MSSDQASPPDDALQGSPGEDGLGEGPPPGVMLNEVARRVIERANARRRGEVVEEPNMPSDAYVDVEVEVVVHLTDKAILVLIDQLGERWIPLSQLRGDPPAVAECDVTLEVSRWFAEKEGLIEKE